MTEPEPNPKSYPPLLNNKDIFSDHWEDVSLGRYTLIKLLGTGGMGRVFLARDKVLAREVALKAIPQRLGDPEQVEYLKQFIHEARVIAALEHENIVRIYDVLTDSGVVAIAMEYIRGGDLQRVVRKRGSLDYKLAVKLILQALRGLAFAHEGGVIHRDIKPGNLMLTTDGQCKLVDFGAARLVHKAELSLLEGKTIGTPYYMPPEIILAKAPSVQSDLYSMACVLWFSLTGNPPYTGETAKHVYTKHVRSALPDAADLGAVPAALGELVLEAMAKDPKDRPASATAFADRLEAILNEDSSASVAGASGRPSSPAVLEKTKIAQRTTTLNTTAVRPVYRPAKSKTPLLIGLIVGGFILLGLLIWGVIAMTSGDDFDMYGDNKKTTTGRTSGTTSDDSGY